MTIITLRALRQDKGLTQLALAEQAGLSLSTIEALERGATLPNYRTLQKLRSVLGSTIDQVQFGDKQCIVDRRPGRPSKAASA